MDGGQQKQQYYQNLIKKYEDRNEQFRDRQCDLRHRLEAIECSMPALLCFNVMRARNAPQEFDPVREYPSHDGQPQPETFKNTRYDYNLRGCNCDQCPIGPNVQQPTVQRTPAGKPINVRNDLNMRNCTCMNCPVDQGIAPIVQQTAPTDRSACTATEPGPSNREPKYQTPPFENMAAADDIRYMAQIKDLLNNEKQLQEELQELEHKEKAYTETLKQTDDVWSNYDMERNGAGDFEAENLKRMNRQLESDNKKFQDELEEIKREIKNVQETVEEPMKKELENQKCRCLGLEEDLTNYTNDITNKENQHRNKVLFLEKQLKNALHNLNDLNLINKRLKEELCMLNCRCNELQTDVINQKLSEIHTVSRMSAAQAKTYQPPLPKPVFSFRDDSSPSPPRGGPSSGDDLGLIARRLSNLLKEADACGTCKKAHHDLIDTVKYIKDLVDIVNSDKKITTGTKIQKRSMGDSEISICKCVDVDKLRAEIAAEGGLEKPEEEIHPSKEVEKPEDASEKQVEDAGEPLEEIHPAKEKSRTSAELVVDDIRTEIVSRLPVSVVGIKEDRVKTEEHITDTDMEGVKELESVTDDTQPETITESEALTETQEEEGDTEAEEPTESELLTDTEEMEETDLSATPTVTEPVEETVDSEIPTDISDLESEAEGKQESAVPFAEVSEFPVGDIPEADVQEPKESEDAQIEEISPEQDIEPEIATVEEAETDVIAVSEVEEINESEPESGVEEIEEEKAEVEGELGVETEIETENKESEERIPSTKEIVGDIVEKLCTCADASEPKLCDCPIEGTQPSAIKLLIKEPSTKSLTEGSPTKIPSKESSTKIPSKESSKKSLTKESTTKIPSKESSKKSLTKDSSAKIPSKEPSTKSLPKDVSPKTSKSASKISIDDKVTAEEHPEQSSKHDLSPRTFKPAHSKASLRETVESQISIKQDISHTTGKQVSSRESVQEAIRSNTSIKPGKEVSSKASITVDGKQVSREPSTKSLPKTTSGVGHPEIPIEGRGSPKASKTPSREASVKSLPTPSTAKSVPSTLKSTSSAAEPVPSETKSEPTSEVASKKGIATTFVDLVPEPEIKAASAISLPLEPKKIHSGLPTKSITSPEIHTPALKESSTKSLPKEDKAVTPKTPSDKVSEEEVMLVADLETEGNVDIEAEIEVVSKSSDGVYVTTTVTSSGGLEVVTEGPTGIVETTLKVTESGNVEVVTGLKEYDDKSSKGTIGEIEPKHSKEEATALRIEPKRSKEPSEAEIKSKASKEVAEGDAGSKVSKEATEEETELKVSKEAIEGDAESKLSRASKETPEVEVLHPPVQGMRESRDLLDIDEDKEEMEVMTIPEREIDETSKLPEAQLDVIIEEPGSESIISFCECDLTDEEGESATRRAEPIFEHVCECGGDNEDVDKKVGEDEEEAHEGTDEVEEAKESIKSIEIIEHIEAKKSCNISDEKLNDVVEVESGSTVSDVSLFDDLVEPAPHPLVEHPSEGPPTEKAEPLEETYGREQAQKPPVTGRTSKSILKHTDSGQEAFRIESDQKIQLINVSDTTSTSDLKYTTCICEERLVALAKQKDQDETDENKIERNPTEDKAGSIPSFPITPPRQPIDDRSSGFPNNTTVNNLKIIICNNGKDTCRTCATDEESDMEIPRCECHKDKQQSRKEFRSNIPRICNVKTCAEGRKKQDSKSRDTSERKSSKGNIKSEKRYVQGESNLCDNNTCSVFGGTAALPSQIEEDDNEKDIGEGELFEDVKVLEDKKEIKCGDSKLLLDNATCTSCDTKYCAVIKSGSDYRSSDSLLNEYDDVCSSTCDNIIQLPLKKPDSQSVTLNVPDQTPKTHKKHGCAPTTCKKRSHATSPVTTEQDVPISSSRKTVSTEREDASQGEEAPGNQKPVCGKSCSSVGTQKTPDSSQLRQKRSCIKSHATNTPKSSKPCIIDQCESPSKRTVCTYHSANDFESKTTPSSPTTRATKISGSDICSPKMKTPSEPRVTINEPTEKRHSCSPTTCINKSTVSKYLQHISEGTCSSTCSGNRKSVIEIKPTESNPCKHAHTCNCTLICEKGICPRESCESLKEKRGSLDESQCSDKKPCSCTLECDTRICKKDSVTKGDIQKSLKSDEQIIAEDSIETFSSDSFMKTACNSLVCSQLEIEKESHVSKRSSSAESGTICSCVTDSFIGSRKSSLSKGSGKRSYVSTESETICSCTTDSFVSSEKSSISKASTKRTYDSADSETICSCATDSFIGSKKSSISKQSSRGKVKSPESEVRTAGTSITDCKKSSISKPSSARVCNDDTVCSCETMGIGGSEKSSASKSSTHSGSKKSERMSGSVSRRTSGTNTLSQKSAKSDFQKISSATNTPKSSVTILTGTPCMSKTCSETKKSIEGSVQEKAKLSKLPSRESSTPHSKRSSKLSSRESSKSPSQEGVKSASREDAKLKSQNNAKSPSQEGYKSPSRDMDIEVTVSVEDGDQKKIEVEIEREKSVQSGTAEKSKHLKESQEGSDVDITVTVEDDKRKRVEVEIEHERPPKTESEMKRQHSMEARDKSSDQGIHKRPTESKGIIEQPSKIVESTESQLEKSTEGVHRKPKPIPEQSSKTAIDKMGISSERIIGKTDYNESKIRKGTEEISKTSTPRTTEHRAVSSEEKLSTHDQKEGKLSRQISKSSSHSKQIKPDDGKKYEDTITKRPSILKSSKSYITAMSDVSKKSDAKQEKKQSSVSIASRGSPIGKVPQRKSGDEISKQPREPPDRDKEGSKSSTRSGDSRQSKSKIPLPVQKTSSEQDKHHGECVCIECLTSDSGTTKGHPSDCDCVDCLCDPNKFRKAKPEIDEPIPEGKVVHSSSCTCIDCLCPGDHVVTPSQKTSDTPQRTPDHPQEGKDSPHPLDCDCLDCLCSPSKSKISSRITIESPKQVLAYACPTLGPIRKHHPNCKCSECVCQPCSHRPDCSCKDCKCDPCKDEVVQFRKHPPECSCPDCICAPCGDDKVNAIKARKAADLERQRLHPPDCNCEDCICEPCGDAEVEAKKSEKQHEVKPEPEKHVDDGSCTCEECLCSPCADSNCNCFICICDPCEDPKMVEKRKPHPPSCNCIECYCNPCSDPKKTRSHPPNCTCRKCICEPCEPASAPSHPPSCSCPKCVCEPCFDPTKKPSVHKPDCRCARCVCTPCKKEDEPPEKKSQPDLPKEVSIILPGENLPVEPTTPSIMQVEEDDQRHSQTCKCTICKEKANKIQKLQEPQNVTCKCTVCKEKLADSKGKTSQRNLPDIPEEWSECDCSPVCVCENCPALKKQTAPVPRTMNDETLKKNIKEIEQENVSREKDMKELQTLMEQIRCACSDAEKQAARTPEPKLIQKASTFKNTLSGLQIAMNTLQEKCKTKDKMIESMTHELRLRADSNLFNEMFKNLADRGPAEVDFDRHEICDSLPRPNNDPKYGRTSYRYATEVRQDGSCVCVLRETVDMEIKNVKQISPNSILVKWTQPQYDQIIGYELMVDNVLKSRIHSAQRTSTVVFGVEIKGKINITVYAITPLGRCKPPATCIYGSS